MADIKSILDMSDEDMQKLDPSTLAFNSDADASDDTADQGDHDLDDKVIQDEVITDVDANAEVKDENAEQGKESDKVDTAEAASGDVKQDGAEKKDAPAPAKADGGEGTKSETDSVKADTPAIDYKAEYERLTGKFKANGREFQVANVDDAISLMQMGIGFNKKMAALKPNLKLMKLLENNQLLDEEKLSFLIDLHKGNPEAINKLVLDSKLDPLDLNADKASEYKPGKYSVDERELVLDDVLAGLQDSPHFTQTMQVVSQKWDKPSQMLVIEQPGLLEVIHDHVSSGIYDLIANEIERERTLGRLKGLSDIQAYQQVGDAMEARGGFAHLVHKGTQTQDVVKVDPPKPAQVDDPKLKDKRRAASSTKTTVPPTKNKVDFNPLGLSDEDFLKQMNPKYL